MSWVKMTEAELDWGLYHAGEALNKLHKAGQFDEVYVGGTSVGPYMDAWHIYNEAVSQQRKGWRNKKKLQERSIPFMLCSASKGNIDPPRGNIGSPQETAP